MQTNELKITFSVGLIFAFRMLGLFMIFPVLTLYVEHYPDASMHLIGMALGCYGLCQALLQLPMAALSDHFGRKPLVLVGLLLFALGGLVAAMSVSIWGVIIGRAIQGAGAIGATLLALAADNTRPVVRTRAMALIGICIGGSFTLAMVMGPILNSLCGLQGLFLASSVLAIIAIGLVLRIPEPKVSAHHLAFRPAELIKAFAQPDLWRLFLSVFSLHALLTMCFLVVPLKIQGVLQLGQQQSWQFYVPVLFVSLLLVAPFIRRGDDGGLQKRFFIVALIGLIGVVPSWLWTQSSWLFMVLGILFFAFFNYLEASMPAIVSKMADTKRRGLILGVYSTCQFLGLFAGGALGGFCIEQWGSTSIVVMSCVLLIVWLLSILGLNVKHNEELSWQEVSTKSY